MNDMTVGMENLPNVFIEKMVVDSSVVSRAPLIVQHKVQVILKMYDYSENKSWRNKIPNLKVKCSFISDDRIEKLNNGSISLFDVPVGALNRTSVISCDDFTFYNTSNGFDTYSKIVETNIIGNINNMNVYVACFIDDLQFGIPMFDKFYGPMSAEKIFVGGNINMQSGYFYYPDTNEEYGGPVHMSNARYMEGSKHTTKEHKTLRYVAEENFKIVSPTNTSPNDIGLGMYAGTDFSTRTPENNGTELRPGFVQPADAPGRRSFPDVPEDVSIEQIPNNPPTEINEW